MDEDPSSLFVTKTHFDFLQLAEESSKLFAVRNPHDPGEEVKPWKKPRASSSSCNEDVDEVVDAGNYDAWEDEEEDEWWLPCRSANAPPPIAKAPPPIAKAFTPMLPSSKAPPAPKACPPVPPWTNMMNVAPVTPPDDPPEQDSQAKPAPKPRGPRKTQVTPEQLAAYRREQATAVFLNMDWNDRGPRPEFGPMPKTWRGGYWSENSRKWKGPRGGAQKEWRDQKYGKAKDKAKK
jgi:hypothetical protein